MKTVWFLLALLTTLGCRSLSGPDSEYRVSVIYEETSGARVSIANDPRVVLRRVPCYDGATEARCFALSCGGVPDDTHGDQDPESEGQ